MLIFISHKIYNYLQVDDNKTVFEVLKLFFTSSIQEPTFISGISMVYDDTEIPIQQRIPALGTGFGKTSKESRSKHRGDIDQRIHWEEIEGLVRIHKISKLCRETKTLMKNVVRDFAQKI